MINNIYLWILQSLGSLLGASTQYDLIIYISFLLYISLFCILYSPTLSSLQLYHLPLGEDISDDLILYQPLGPRMPLPRTLYVPCLVMIVSPSLMPSLVVQIAISPPSSKIKNGGYILVTLAGAFKGVASTTTSRTLKMLKIIRTKIMGLKVFMCTIINNLFNKNKYFLLFNEFINGLSNLASSLLNKEPIEAEIKEFEKYANNGVIFLLVEPTEKILGEKVGGKNIGNFYVKSFEYIQSEFIYSNKPQKTIFKVVFTEYNL